MKQHTKRRGRAPGACGTMMPTAEKTSSEAKCAVAREGHPCCSDSDGKGVEEIMISMASSSFLPRVLLAGITGWLHGGLPATAAFSHFKDT